MQLGGNQGPARIWAAGDVTRLEARISMTAVEGSLDVQVESVTTAGKRCRAQRVIRGDAPGSQREALPCL